MKRTKVTIAASLLLSIFIGSWIIVSYASAAQEEETLSDVQAEEVIYTLLSSDGTPSLSYSVVTLISDSNGIAEHCGNYTEVLNLSGSEKPEYTDGKIRIPVNKGKTYYQGKLNETALPWSFQITYTLDGNTISAKELAGKSGELSINIKTTKGPYENEWYYNNYMLQITVALDGDLCSNIVSDGGMIASSGSNKTIACSVLPGSDGDFTISAAVTNFSMSGITIAALQYDPTSIVGDIEGIESGLTNLVEGADALSKGAQELASGAGLLNDGANQFGSALQMVSSSAPTLSAASKKISLSLSAIASGLQNADVDEFSKLAILPETLKTIESSLTKISGSLELLSENYRKSYDVFSQMFSAIPEGPSEEELAELYSIAPNNPALEKLVANYTALKQLVAAWEAVRPAFTAVYDTLPTVTLSIQQIAASLSEMVAGISDSLGSLDDLATLCSVIISVSTGYDEFHSGLEQFTDGVTSLNAGWGELSDGIDSLTNGLSDFSDGADEFNNGISAIPEIFKQFFSNSEKDHHTSFLDERNENTASVQFVISTQAISPPEQQEVIEKPEEELNLFERIWERLKALFQ